ncbi:uncharacterized protein LOC143179019 [Calliopsis andreniformis]|uniref:uncharacterized protein LOC143179019 n=1 Tax=Calliopsis andreniformis TaxID=337506 RepID=UPI003FCC5510
MALVGPYLVCPFDKSHRIIEGRLQIHLFKCRKNYPPGTKVVCYFDVTHMLNPLEYEHHLSVCPTSGIIKHSQVSIGDEGIEVGSVPLEDACTLETNTLDEDDWTGNSATYNPLAATEHKPVVRMGIGLSKAKKKQFRRQERERIAALENKYDMNSIKQEIAYKEPEFEKPLRRPKQAAKALTCNQSESVSITDLTSKLKEVSMGNVLKRSTTKAEEKENISENKVNITMTNGIALKTNEVKTKNLSETNSQPESKILKVEPNTLENLNKKKESESPKILRASPRIAASLCGEMKKITTGRGFTIAYQNCLLKADISGKKGKDKSNVDFKTIYGYDENEDNIESQNKTS